MTKLLLRLTDPLDGTSVVAEWAGALFDLGARLSKKHDAFAKNQLIVAISVPNRELAAVLVGFRGRSSIPSMIRVRERELLTAFHANNLKRF
jgi:hypothetical protein